MLFISQNDVGVYVTNLNGTNLICLVTSRLCIVIDVLFLINILYFVYAVCLLNRLSDICSKGECNTYWTV